MLYIRADANSEIATGHVMRCLTIAAELKKRGEDVAFLTADHCADEWIAGCGFPCVSLASRWDDLEEEIPKIIAYITANHAEKLLVDSYYATDKYFCQLNKYTKIIYIDDLGVVKYPVDMLVNYGILATERDYRTFQRGNNKTELLLGTAFVPLRAEFRGIEHKVREKAQSVLITAGGSDVLNTAGNLAGYFATQWEKEGSEDPLEFHVAAGVMNTHIKSLLALEEIHPNVHIHRNVKKMSALMCGCDVAVSACGSTIYELCACKVPTIAFSLADNQVQGLKALSKRAWVVSCGDCRGDMGQFVESAYKELRSLVGDYEKRKALCTHGESLVDGKGAKRIAERISQMKGKP